MSHIISRNLYRGSCIICVMVKNSFEGAYWFVNPNFHSDCWQFDGLGKIIFSCGPFVRWGNISFQWMRGMVPNLIHVLRFNKCCFKLRVRFRQWMNFIIWISFRKLVIDNTDLQKRIKRIVWNLMIAFHVLFSTDF